MFGDTKYKIKMAFTNMVYSFQERINNFILWFKNNKRYSLKEGEVGINLGSDIETIPAFVGVDGSSLIYLMRNPFFPEIIKNKIYANTWTATHCSLKRFVNKIKSVRIIHHNLLYGLPFKDNSINFIFSSHIIEHLDEKTALKIFEECFRVMKMGGRMRVVVPDLDEEVKTIEGKIKAYKRTGDGELLRDYVTVPSHASSFSFHRKMYNFQSLKLILKIVGFKEIKRMKRFEGSFPHVDKLDVRDGLIVEVVK